METLSPGSSCSRHEPRRGAVAAAARSGGSRGGGGSRGRGSDGRGRGRAGPGRGRKSEAIKAAETAAKKAKTAAFLAVRYPETSRLAREAGLASGQGTDGSSADAAACASDDEV